MKPGNKNSFKSLTTIKINNNEYHYYSLRLAEKNGLLQKIYGIEPLILDEIVSTL